MVGDAINFHPGPLPEKWRELVRQLLGAWHASGPLKESRITVLIRDVFESGRSGAITFLASFGGEHTAEYRRVFKIDVFDRAIKEKAGSQYLRQLQARAFCDILNNPQSAVHEWPEHSGKQWSILEYEYAGGFSASDTGNVHSLSAFVVGLIRESNRAAIADFQRIIDDVTHDLLFKLYPPYHRIKIFRRAQDAFPGKLDHLSRDLLDQIRRLDRTDSLPSTEDCHARLTSTLAQSASENFLEASQLHGDLNPNNVLIFERADQHHGVLIDFCEAKFRDDAFRPYYWDFARIECELILAIFEKSLNENCSPRDFVFHLMTGTSEGTGTLHSSLEVLHKLRRSFFRSSPSLDVPPASRDAARIFTVTTLVFFLFYLKFHANPDEHRRAPLALAFAMGVCEALENFRPSFLSSLSVPRKGGRRLGFPYVSLELFVGRRAEIQRIEQGFAAKSTVVLCGMTGQGKTHLAIKYADQHRDAYEYIFWVAGESAQKIRDSFADHARELLSSELALVDRSDQSTRIEVRGDTTAAGDHGQTSDFGMGPAKIAKRDAVSLFKDWLQERDDWLIIVDNLEHAADLKELPAFARGHTLITTQLQDLLHTGGYPVPIESLDPYQALTLLVHRARGTSFDIQSLKPTDHNDARQIVLELGAHPLALDQAGAYLAPDRKFGHYLALLEKAQNEVLARRGSHFSHDLAVAASFQVVCGRAADADPKAFRILEGCSMLAPDAIPFEFFEHATAGGGFDAAGEMLRTLCGLSLLTLDADTSTVRMHRLLQKFILGSLTAATKLDCMKELVGIFKPWLSRTKQVDLTQPLLVCAEQLAYHIIDANWADGISEDYVSLAGVNLYEGKQFAQARSLFEASIAWLKTHDRGPRERAVAYGNSAHSCYQLGEFMAGLEHWEQAVSIYETIDRESEDVGYAQHEIGNCLRKLNRLEEAVQSFELAIDIRRRLSPFSISTAHSMNGLAWVHLDAGDYSAAITSFSQSLACYQSLSEPNPEAVASEMNMLGIAYYRSGQFEAALERFKDALAIRLIAGDSEEVGFSLHNVGDAYFQMGKVDEGIDAHRQAREVRNRLGLKAQAADSCLEIARILRTEGGRSLEISDLYLTCIELQMESGLPDQALVNLKALAAYTREIESPENASAIVQSTLANYHSLEDAARTDANMANRLGLVFSDGIGDQREALTWFERASTIGRATDNEDTPIFLGNMATMHENLGEPEERIRCLEELVALREREHTKAMPLIEALDSLGRAFTTQGKCDRAFPIFQRVLRLTSNLPDIAPLLRATYLNNAGAAAQLLGKFAEAGQYHALALEIRKAEHHPDALTSLNALGTAHYSSRNFTKALELFDEAVRISSEGPALDRALYLENAGHTCTELQDFKSAIQYFTQLLEIRREALTDTHPQTIDAMTYLGLAYQNGRDFDASLPFFAEAARLSERAAGISPLSRATYLHSAGLACVRANKFSDAVEYLEPALAIRRQELSALHVDTINSMNGLGAAYSHLRADDKALPLFEEAVSLAAALPEVLPLGLAQYASNAGSSASRLGNHSKAVAYYTRALDLRRTALKDHHPETIATIASLGTEYSGMNDHSTALQFHEEAIRLSAETPEVNQADRADYLNQAGVDCSNLKLHGRAGEYFSAAMEISDATGTPTAVGATLRNNLIVSLKDAGHYEEAFAQACRALRFIKKHTGPSAELGRLYHCIGLICPEMGKFRKALQYDLRAYRMRLQTLGDSAATATSANNAAIGYERDGKLTLAREYHLESLRIRREVLGENHSATLTSYENFMRVCARMGDEDGTLSAPGEASGVLTQAEILELLAGTTEPPPQGTGGLTAEEIDALLSSIPTDHDEEQK